jgi:hypothetical protein
MSSVRSVVRCSPEKERMGEEVRSNSQQPL